MQLQSGGMPAIHAMYDFNGLAMGGTPDFYAWGSVLILFVAGLTAVASWPNFGLLPYFEVAWAKKSVGNENESR